MRKRHSVPPTETHAPRIFQPITCVVSYAAPYIAPYIAPYAASYIAFIFPVKHSSKPFRLKTITPGFLQIPGLKKLFALRVLKKRILSSVLARHGYIVAKSGSGKSELLKILLFIIKLTWSWRHFWFRVNPRRSVILLDPHGDVAFESARQQFFFTNFKETLHQGKTPDLVFISHGFQNGFHPCLNPFDVVGKNYTNEDLEVLAQCLTGAFATMLGRGDVHLTLQMRTLLTPIFLVLLTFASRKQATPTFFDLERFLDDRHNDDLIAYGINHLPGKGQRHFFQHLFKDGRFQTTKFALRVRLASLLNSRAFVDLLSLERSSWDLETLMNQGKTIIINASKSHLGDAVSEIYGRTITALVQSYAFMRGGRAHKTPTFFIIDEASNFISDDIKTILAESRKFGLHLILVNQIVKQGSASNEFHETIMGNTALKIIGNSSETTRRSMARECDTAPEHFRGLRVGTFLVKSDTAHPFLLKLPKFWLGNRGCMKPEHWKQFCDDLLERYYRSSEIVDFSASPATDHFSSELNTEYGSNFSSFLGSARPLSHPVSQ